MNFRVFKKVTAPLLMAIGVLFMVCQVLPAQTYFSNDPSQKAIADSIVVVARQIQKTDPDSAIRYSKYHANSGAFDSLHALLLRNVFINIYANNGELDSALTWHRRNEATLDQLKKIPEVPPRAITTLSFSLYFGLGKVYYYQYQLDSVEKYAAKAKEAASRLQDKARIATANSLLTAIYATNGDIDKALELALELAESARVRGDTSEWGTNLNNIASFYKKLNNTPKAIDSYIKMLELAEHSGDGQILINAYSGLSQVYFRQKEYDISLEYLKKAHALEVEGMAMKKGYVLAELGDVYKNLEKMDSAMYFYEKSLDQFVRIGSPDDEAYLLERIAALMLATDKPKEALAYSEKGLEILQDLNSPSDELLLWISNSQALMNLGRMQQAKASAQKVLELAEELEDPTYLSNAYELVHVVFSKLGDYPKAYRYLEQFHAYEDSVRSEEQIRALSRAEYQFALEQEKESFEANQREQELIYEQEIARQRIIAIAVSVVALVLIIAVFLVIRSNRQRARTNEELASANGKLHQLDQFKTRLFANINHDIRTPLTLIRGYAINIQGNENNYLTEASEQDLNHLQQNTMLLSEMTNEIQDLLLLEENKLKLTFNRIEISGYVDRLVKMFSSLAELSDITLSYEDQIKRELIVHLDQGHFDKVFYNLISNAFRYTAAGGSIEVVLKEEDEVMVIQIADSGKGIAPEDLPHIFDRFYQSPLNEYRSKEGFGIGLAVVQELINLHEGEITVESQLAVGTSFTVRLPFNLDKPADEPLSFNEALSKNHPVRPARGTMISTEEQDKKTILVVDDHAEIRQYITSILSQQYQVKEASDGKQALAVLEVNHINMIITDLMMPWLDGYDLIEQLKATEKYSDIPVMVVSARTTEEDKHRVLDAGVNEFIAKPFDPAELQKRIQNVLNGNGHHANKWVEVVNDQQTLTTLEQNVLKKLNQIIMEHVADPNLSTELLAEELSASRSKAIRMIKSLTDKTPLAYIKEIRMNYVDDLIKKQKVKNASEAARAIGMKHATHFSKQYKSHFGELPDFGK